MTRVGALIFCFCWMLLAARCDAGVFAWFASDAQEAVEPGESEALAQQEYIDLDKYELEESGMDSPETYVGDWAWQVLPEGLVYSNYLAGNKESRLSGTFVNVDDDGWMLDATLGSRVGILRYGTMSGVFPEGFQIDVEGSAQLRLDMENNVDVNSVDFRGGLPLSFGAGRRRWKLGYYHLSSHLGDEFLLRNPGYPRLNYVRDVFLLGHTVFLSPRLRAYGEAGWAFNKDVSGPWEFQVGLDYAPLGPTGARGAPFFALNGHLREEVNFGGTFTAQAGWAWRSDFSTPLLRAGFHYLNGKSNHFSFYNDHEQQFGLGLWYDF